nr:10648_t:CDS:2 [Entrophospora candida]
MKEERSISYFTDLEGNGPLFEMIIQKREYVVLKLDSLLSTFHEV